jgi:hypothetical protein
MSVGLRIALEFTAASNQSKQIPTQIPPGFFFTDATTLLEQQESGCRAALSQNNSF